MKKALFVVTLLLLWASLAFGQIQNGAPNFTANDSHKYDTVNLMTNTVVLNVSVRSKAGIIPFNFALSTNSNAVPVSSAWAMGMLANVYPTSLSGGNWAYGPNAYLGFGPNLVFGAHALTATSFGACGTKYTNWVYTDSNATNHPMGSSFWTTTSTGTGCQQTATGTTTDDSGISFTATGSSAATAYDRDGDVLFNNITTSSFTDRNGNALTWNAPLGNPINFVDAMGQTAIAAASQSSGPFLNFQWTDVNGGTPEVSTTTSSLTFKTNFGCSGISEIPATALTASTGFTLADGRSLSYTYEGTPSNSGKYTGRIGTITLPTGGTIAYTYSGGSNGIDCTYAVPPTLTRTLSNGDVTTYSLAFSLISGSNYKAINTVTDQGGNQTLYRFTGFTSTGTSATNAQLLTQIQNWQGNTSTGTELSEERYCYNASLSTCVTNLSTLKDSTASLPITSRITFTQVNGQTNWKAHEEHFDTYGNMTYSAEYDYGVTGSSTPTKDATITYGTWNGSSCVALTNTHVLDTPCDIVSKVAGTTVAETRITYDGNGNETKLIRWDGNTTWVGNTTANVYNSNGTVSKSYDANNNETDYSYSSSSYSQCSSCTQYTFPTQIKNAGTGNYTNFTYYGQGGVVNAITDRNGATTTDYYTTAGGTAEPYWRILRVSDPLSAVTTNVYPSSSSTTTSSSKYLFNSSNSVIGAVTTADALGRVSNIQVPQSPTGTNYDTTSYSYSWNGTAKEISSNTVACSAASGSMCSTPYTVQTDPIGRLTQTSHGASYETVTHTYTGLDDLITLSPAPSGENTKTRVKEYDGLGRVTIDCKIGAGFTRSCGTASGSYQGVATTFSYGSASSPATTYAQKSRTDGTNTQTIKSIFDGLSRISSITQPGPTLNYYYDLAPGSCPGSAANTGNLTCYKDSLNTRGYAYDSQNRVTLDNANGNLCRHFYYDNSSGYSGTLPTGVTLANQYGRMVEAATDSCAANTLITDEWFAYDAVGNVTDMWEKTPHSTQYYHSTSTFYENGVVHTTALSSPSLYTMSFDIEGEGRLKQVKDITNNGLYASGATYFPSSNPETTTVFSSDSNSFTRDTTTGRMTQYQFTVNSLNYTGALTWNPSGTLKTLATTDAFGAGTMTCHYNPTDVAGTGYNDFNQLVGFDCGSGNWGQTFSYDTFENMTKTKMSSRNGTSFNPGFSQTNNHVTGDTYDNNGNVTADGSYTYGWGDTGQMKWAASSGTPTCGTSGNCITYDALGRIVETSSGSTYTERWYTPSGVVYMNGASYSLSYWPAPHGATAYTDTNSTHLYMHPNHLGTKPIISKSDHSVAYEYAYSPYGETMYNSAGCCSTEQNYTSMFQNVYPGVMWDADNREQSIAANRWLSMDPAHAGLNQYVATSNPNSFIDPSGLYLIAPWGGVGGGFGGGGDPWGGVDCTGFGFTCGDDPGPGNPNPNPGNPPGQGPSGGSNPNGQSQQNSCSGPNPLLPCRNAFGPPEDSSFSWCNAIGEEQGIDCATGTATVLAWIVGIGAAIGFTDDLLTNGNRPVIPTADGAQQIEVDRFTWGPQDWYITSAADIAEIGATGVAGAATVPILVTSTAAGRQDVINPPGLPPTVSPYNQAPILNPQFNFLAPSGPLNSAVIWTNFGAGGSW